MNLLRNHYSRVVCQDLLIKYIYKNSNLLPKFNKVSLSAKFNTDYRGGVVSLFEILTFNKPSLTLSKVNSLSLNLRKGQLAGVKITLRQKHLFDFLERFLLEIYPHSKKTKISCINGKYAHFQFKDLFGLEENNILYIYLQGVNSLDLVIENSSSNPYLFKACRFPVIKKEN